MRILITNDDGIHSPGLEALEKIAREISGDVWVVAPETDQSGVAHSLSLNDPLRLRRLGEKRFAVKGTPTDCVILASRHIMKNSAPELVLSGVNRGHNLGEDVTYSGTVAGAMEGALLGIPAIALSQGYPLGSRELVDYSAAIEHGPGVIRNVLKAGLPPGALANVNFPPLPAAGVKGLRATRQGQRAQWQTRIDERRDGRNNPYFWIMVGHESGDPEADTDLKAVSEGYISVTPLKIDMTDHALKQKFDAAIEGK